MISVHTMYVYTLCMISVHTTYVYTLCMISVHTMYVYTLCMISVHTTYVYTLCMISVHTMYVCIHTMYVSGLAHNVYFLHLSGAEATYVYIYNHVMIPHRLLASEDNKQQFWSLGV